MAYQQILIALSREIELLEKVLSLSEHHLELIADENFDGFEMFWPLLANPMQELGEAEMELNGALADLDENDVLSSKELTEIDRLAASISELAHRIADIDERTMELVNAPEPTISKLVS